MKEIVKIKPEAICILGATGSIGTNTLDVIRRHPDKYQVFALTAHRNIEQLKLQCVEFKPKYAVLPEAEEVDIKIEDKENWRILFQGYANFYQVEINDNITNTVWQWLHTSEHELQGLVGEINNKVIAFAHYRRMPSPLRGKDIGFLDDLYVLPECRGQKIGEKLIEQLKQISKDKKWNLVRWITRDNNVRAKKVYDKVSNKTNWDVYELS